MSETLQEILDRKDQEEKDLELIELREKIQDLIDEDERVDFDYTCPICDEAQSTITSIREMLDDLASEIEAVRQSNSDLREAAEEHVESIQNQLKELL